MTEGEGVTGGSAREEGVGAGSAAPAPAADPVTSSSSANLPAAPQEVEPYVRVDGRKIESALLALRHLIVEVPLYLAAPGVDEARAERRKRLSQLDGYPLPPPRQSRAPVPVAPVGSPGAGQEAPM